MDNRQGNSQKRFLNPVPIARERREKRERDKRERERQERERECQRFNYPLFWLARLLA